MNVIYKLRPELRDLAKVVFRKGKVIFPTSSVPDNEVNLGGSTQSKSMEMTYEEIQRELGLGVEIN